MVDAGVPWPAVLRPLGWPQHITDPQRTYFSFEQPSAVSGPFVGDPNAGQWQTLVTDNANPCWFVPRQKGDEIAVGEFRYLQNGNVQIALRVAEHYNVRAPVPDPHPAVLTDEVAVVVDNGRTYIRAGRAGTYGIDMHFIARSNDGSSGQLAAIQLVRSVRDRWMADDTHWRTTTNGAYVLDMEANQQTYLYLDRMVPVGVQLAVSDSPAQEVDDTVSRISVDDRFLMTLMFRSDQSNAACWVPLQTVAWHWQAQARRTGPGAWTIEPGSEVRDDPPEFVPGPGAVTWTSNIRQYDYVQI
jgi:hypothetical protein